MIFKILACTIIMIASTYIGVFKANSYKQRVRELRQLQMILQNLESEIVYSYTPLGEAFYSIANSSKGAIDKIFIQTADILDLREGLSFKQAWDKALDANFTDTSLNADDRNILKVLGSNLGISDEESQRKYINLVIDKLKIEEVKAQGECSKNERLYKSLGFIGGAMVVILLF